MNELTTRQKEIYDYMIKYFLQEHTWPSYRQMADYFNVNFSGFETHVAAIIKKGFLIRQVGGYKLPDHELCLKKNNG